MENRKEMNGNEMLEALEELRKDPKEREKMNKSWERMTARESKKGQAGEMTAMFMKAIRF
jgi:hypothetical protein